MYGYLADALVCVHVLYCGYVVLGQAAIVVAAPFKWEWARNPWFRFTHLLAIAVVVLEVGMGWKCPLTTWEEQLRELAGQDVNAGNSFLGRLAHDTLFFDAPPINLFTDAAVLGRMTDSVLMVVDVRSTTRQATITAKELLVKAKVPLAGMVVKNTAPVTTRYHNRYYERYYMDRLKQMADD